MIQHVFLFPVVAQVWSPFAISQDDGDNELESKTRLVFSQNDYVDLLVHNGPTMSHDYTNGSTEEDPRMIAFFDTLVQHELEATTDDDGPLDSSVEVVNNEISDLEGSLTQTDVESLSSPLSLASLPRASTEFNTSFGLPYSNSDSLTSPSQSVGSTSSSSSSSDDNGDDADKPSDSSDSSSSAINTVLSEAGENGTRSTSPNDAVLNRLKRMRQSIVSDSDSQSQDADSRRKRRHVQTSRFPVPANQSSVSETEQRVNSFIVHGKKEQNVSSSNGTRNAVDEQCSDCNRESGLSQSRKQNERMSKSKCSRCSAPTGDAPDVPTTVYGNDDVPGYSFNVSSSDCDPVSNEAPNVASNGSAKGGQAVKISVGSGSNGTESTGVRFRQIQNRVKLSDRKYRTSARTTKESDSDSD